MVNSAAVVFLWRTVALILFPLVVLAERTQRWAGGWDTCDAVRPVVKENVTLRKMFVHEEEQIRNKDLSFDLLGKRTRTLIPEINVKIGWRSNSFLRRSPGHRIF